MDKLSRAFRSERKKGRNGPSRGLRGSHKLGMGTVPFFILDALSENLLDSYLPGSDLAAQWQRK
jgi:hypothetical protein